MPHRNGAESIGRNWMGSRWLRVAAITAAVALGALLAAGCGSSSKSKSTTTATVAVVTKAAFLTRANAICEQGNAALQPLEAKLGPNSTPAQVRAFASGPFARSVQTQISAIRALTPPNGEGAVIGHILDVAQADLNRVKSDPLLLGGTPFHSFVVLAHPYGLIECAKNAG